MPIDPDDPPIWLRKLHVIAKQLSPDEYPAKRAEGILQVCRLSSAQRKLMRAFSDSHSGEQGTAIP